MTVQEDLSSFAEHLSFKSLSEEVVHRVKYCLLDTLGAILAGVSTPLASQCWSLAKQIGGASESILIGDGSLVPSMWAAIINGAIGHAHELDDGDRYALGHPGVTTIPAALAIGERQGSSGEEFITAIVLGYEAFSRISRGVNPSLRGRGFHPTATCGTFGAALAAGKLLGFDSDRLSSALGIAGIQAAGLGSGSGESMLKPIGVGKSSGNGVLAALLAQMDIPTSTTIIEGERGFASALSDSHDIPSMTRDLGKRFLILDSYVKFHAACRHTHPMIDAALELTENHDLKPSDILEIVVGTYQYAVERLSGKDFHYRPPSPHAAKFSVPFTVALAIAKRKADLDTFSWETIQDPTILELTDKVKVVEDEEITKLIPKMRGATVTIKTTDGKALFSKFPNPLGEPENLDFGMVEDKYRYLATRAISEENAERLLGTVMNLENVKDIASLTEYLVSSGGG